jgi:hypothetical protein
MGRSLRLLPLLLIIGGAALFRQDSPCTKHILFHDQSTYTCCIRQLVFGSLDGLLVTLGVISGVAGSTGNAHAVIVAGVAEAFAGALLMGAGEFISARSEGTF